MSFTGCLVTRLTEILSEQEIVILFVARLCKTSSETCSVDASRILVDHEGVASDVLIARIDEVHVLIMPAIENYGKESNRIIFWNKGLVIF